MAASQENLLSLTGKDGNTFTKQREHSLKKSVGRPTMLQADVSTLQGHQHLRAMHLLQRWHELKERELTAQQHNRQLLKQFEKAQDTVREMLTLTTAMKTIRMEYERYLEESSPRWQQQLKEKTQAAQRKKMEEYLKSRLKNTEDRVTKCSADRPLLPQGSSTKAQINAAPQKHYNQNSHVDYNQDGFTHLPYMQPSWQTHPQSQIERLPIGAHTQFSSRVPPSFLPPPIFSHPLQPHYLPSMPGHLHSWSMHKPPGRASPQPDHPWSWTASAAGIHSGCEALWGHLYTEEPSPEREEAEASRASSSKRERDGGSRSSHLSQELDIRPVRLSGGPAESSESSMESSQASRERRKKRGRSQRTSTDRERRCSQESSRTSSATITPAVTVAQSSESDVSSEKGSTSNSRRRRRSSAGLAIGPPKAEKVVTERTRSDRNNSGSHEEESQSTAEESRSQKEGDQSPDHKSESCREESGSQREEEESESVGVKIESGGEDMSSSSEENSVEEKAEKTEHNIDLKEGDDDDDDDDDGDGKEDSQRDEEDDERDAQDADVSDRKSTTEEEETGAEKEMEEQQSDEAGDQEVKPDRLKDEDKGKRGSASSPDEEASEDESEGRADKMEDESDEEEQEGDTAGEPEEERDSEDSIITPQNKCKKLHIIPEEEREDESEEEEEKSKTGPSDDDSNEFSDEDIERQLAPQEQSQRKEEKELRADEKPKVCDKVEIFQVELDRSANKNQSSDSEEFDHFYD